MEKNLKFDPKNWDWYAFLDASEEIKQEYSIEASNEAKGWRTCACGQVCNVLPKGVSGSPKDRRARYLGLDFNSQIHDENWEEAKKTLDEIEARTIFLLQQPNFIDSKTL
jgi:hypothetical protein